MTAYNIITYTITYKACINYFVCRALFPCGDNMVCIIDDREDVWRHATNLIHVRPYSFFQSTGDINAPPPPGEFHFIILINLHS